MAVVRWPSVVGRGCGRVAVGNVGVVGARGRGGWRVDAPKNELGVHPQCEGD